jgi:alpha-ribazole phosphatase/probable phosphoglycerate mutase
MVTVLYLIRHGETVGSEARRYKGTLDVPLSEEGARQAARLADYLGERAKGAAALYTSPLSRSARTAEPIARALGLEPQAVPALRERHFGLWEGMSFDEIGAAYPDAFRDWANDPLRHRPVGGESTLEVRDRAVGAIEEILKRHEGGTVVVVAHGGVNRVALCHFTGLPLENIFRLEQDFACVNVVEFHGGFPVLKLLNHTPAGGPGPSRRVFG